MKEGNYFFFLNMLAYVGFSLVRVIGFDGVLVSGKKDTVLVSFLLDESLDSFDNSISHFTGSNIGFPTLFLQK